VTACTYPDVKIGRTYEAPDGSKSVEVLDIDCVGSIQVRLQDETTTWWHILMLRDWREAGIGPWPQWFKWVPGGEP